MKKLLNILHWLYRKLRDTRGEMDIPKMKKVKIGNVVYEVVSYFKKNSTVTAEDKIFKLMEKELDVTEDLCYTELRANSKESLDCKPDIERRAV
jgi:hypothetical protein